MFYLRNTTTFYLQNIEYFMIAKMLTSYLVINFYFYFNVKFVSTYTEINLLKVLKLAVDNQIKYYMTP